MEGPHKSLCFWGMRQPTPEEMDPSDLQGMRAALRACPFSIGSTPGLYPQMQPSRGGEILQRYARNRYFLCRTFYIDLLQGVPAQYLHVPLRSVWGPLREILLRKLLLGDCVLGFHVKLQRSSASQILSDYLDQCPLCDDKGGLHNFPPPSSA